MLVKRKAINNHANQKGETKARGSPGLSELLRTKNKFMYNAHFTRTSESTANLLLSGPGFTPVLITDIVSCPRLMVDQRGLELDLLCTHYGIKLDEVEITGIATLSEKYNHEKDWVAYQAKNWRSVLGRNLSEYNAQQEAYTKSRIQ